MTYFLHSHHHHQSPELQQNVRRTHHRRVRGGTTSNNATPVPARTPQTTASHNTDSMMMMTTTNENTSHDHDHHHATTQERLAQRLEEEPPGICCSSEDPVRDLEILHQMADILVVEKEQRERKRLQEQEKISKGTTNTLSPDNQKDVTPPEDEAVSTNNDDVMAVDGAESHSSGSTDSHDGDDEPQAPHNEENDRKLLLRMSMNTAIAIGLHNFPEGLATFVATLHDPSVGIVLAIAIAIHNIPEGLCVALPVYYATGSRRKAFGWALLSGLSEPLAAVFGYIILANAVTATVYGILFGIIAGMMVMISTRELLPTAHRYDPTDRVVTYSFIFGMGILALSLVLFTL